MSLCVCLCVTCHVPSVDLVSIIYWASEASPTQGCSIEISRDIYIYVCLSYVKLTA